MTMHSVGQSWLAPTADQPSGLARPAVPAPRAAGRMRQLDGLRAMAAIGVVATHTWFPGGMLGDWRMRLFFVLSGFLICGILLHGRDLRAQGRTTGRQFVRSFYARRALRLLPPLFLTIILSKLVNYSMGESIWWHLAQSTNLYIAITGDMAAGSLNHLWSLNIEEQFCLLFPALLLLAPEAWLALLLLGGVAAQCIYDYAGLTLGWNSATMVVLAPNYLASFCLGGLLALAKRGRINLPYLPIAAICLFAISVVLSWSTSGAVGAGPAMEVAGGLVLTLLLCTVVGLAAAGKTGPFGRILESEPLVKLGMLSYGIYLYHLPIVGVLLRLRLHFHLGPTPLGPAHFITVLALATLAAMASRRLLEDRFERWKSAFPYASGARSRDAQG